MSANLGLAPDSLEGLIEILNDTLADQHVLYIKLRNYHWNVTGPTFLQLHQLFEDQYTQLEAAIDETAERVRYLGGNPLGTLAEFVERSQLKEKPGDVPTAEKMVANLLADHEAVVRKLRANVDVATEQYDDQGTGDLLIGFMQAHEKMAWMLRATLNK